VGAASGAAPALPRDTSTALDEQGAQQHLPNTAGARACRQDHARRRRPAASQMQ